MPLVKFDASDETTQKLMAFTNTRVASKAFYFAAALAPELADDLREAHEEIARLRRVIERQAQVLESARSAAMHLVEAAGQGDLFMATQAKVDADRLAFDREQADLNRLERLGL